MLEVLIPIITALASFIGTYTALKVHVDYLRRDVDLAHRRLDKLANILNVESATFDRRAAG